MGRPYWECPKCHAHLDLGERCDCEREKEQKRKRMEELCVTENAGQLAFNFNWEGGRVEV